MWGRLRRTGWESLSAEKMVLLLASQGIIRVRGLPTRVNWPPEAAEAEYGDGLPPAEAQDAVAALHTKGLSSLFWPLRGHIAELDKTEVFRVLADHDSCSGPPEGPVPSLRLTPAGERLGHG